MKEVGSIWVTPIGSQRVNQSLWDSNWETTKKRSFSHSFSTITLTITFNKSNLRHQLCLEISDLPRQLCPEILSWRFSSMTKRQCVRVAVCQPPFYFRTHKVTGKGEGSRMNAEGVGVMDDNGLIIKSCDNQTVSLQFPNLIITNQWYFRKQAWKAWFW